MQPRQRRGRTVWPVAAALGLALAVPLAALAHGGGTEPTVVLEPTQVTAGGAVTIVGENMEPTSDREILLVGQKLIVQFGTVKTDADGMFTLQVTVPSHLPGGIYQVQAIGDETISTNLEVIGAAGMPSVAPAAQEVAKPRKLEGIGMILLIGVIGLLVLAGGLLVVFGERLAGHRST